MIGFADSTLDNDEIKALIKEDLMSDNECCIVAKDDDEPIGLISIDFINELDFNGNHYTAAIPLIFVEDNNPHKFLHFAIADTLIDVNQEYLTDNKTVTQYILGISNISDILNISLSTLAKK